jgi:hypothetical protein
LVELFLVEETEPSSSSPLVPVKQELFGSILRSMPLDAACTVIVSLVDLTTKDYDCISAAASLRNHIDKSQAFDWSEYHMTIDLMWSSTSSRGRRVLLAPFWLPGSDSVQSAEFLERTAGNADEDYLVRANALLALGHHETQASKAFSIAEQLIQSGSSEMRRTASGALTKRLWMYDIGRASSLFSTWVASESDVAVLANLVNGSGELLAQDPSLRSSVERMSSSHPDERVRAAARYSLEQAAKFLSEPADEDPR